MVMLGEGSDILVVLVVRGVWDTNVGDWRVTWAGLGGLVVRA